MGLRSATILTKWAQLWRFLNRCIWMPTICRYPSPDLNPLRLNRTLPHSMDAGQGRSTAMEKTLHVKGPHRASVYGLSEPGSIAPSTGGRLCTNIRTGFLDSAGLTTGKHPAFP